MFFFETEIFEVDTATLGPGEGFVETGRLLLEVVPHERMKDAENITAIINRRAGVDIISCC